MILFEVDVSRGSGRVMRLIRGKNEGCFGFLFLATQPSFLAWASGAIPPCRARPLGAGLTHSAGEPFPVGIDT